MNVLSLLFKRDAQKYLGRWTVDYCDRVLHTKVLLANQDHCGTCHSIVPIQPNKATLPTNKSIKGNQRYNEYIDAAIRNRVSTARNASMNENDRMTKEIEYYVCTR